MSEVTHQPFPSIEQYRHTIKLVRERAQITGVPLPTLLFHGSVKLHGTNAAVGFTETGDSDDTQCDRIRRIDAADGLRERRRADQNRCC